MTALSMDSEAEPCVRGIYVQIKFVNQVFTFQRKYFAVRVSRSSRVTTHEKRVLKNYHRLLFMFV